jgi:hypothetical protein
MALVFAVAGLLESTLSACAKTGYLVRPIPATVPSQTSTPQPPTPPPDAPAKPAQDSNGH